MDAQRVYERRCMRTERLQRAGLPFYVVDLARRKPFAVVVPLQRLAGYTALSIFQAVFRHKTHE